jgi:membrane-associated protease RseP (regulator of RpoE activity)
MKSKYKSYLLHFSLFAVTFVTTTLAGAEWTNGKSVLKDSWYSINTDYSWADFALGLPYSICFLMILTAHEFGHYFTAIYYRVKTTLPYFIPLPPQFLLGTMGALIRLKSPVRSSLQNFDIGIAGPLTGFVVAIGFLFYGFTHLPPPEYIFQFHPEYQQFGLDYAKHVYTVEFLPPGTAILDMRIGSNLLFWLFENYVADPVRVPNAHEMMHYPILLAGFLSLVFTSMNLLPIGQLDGGHVLYGLIGFKRHRMVASIVFLAFLFYAGIGLFTPYQPVEELVYEIPLFIGFMFFSLRGLGLSVKNTILLSLAIFTVQYALAAFIPAFKGYSGWLLFLFVIGRFVGIAHPPSEIELPLTLGRKILGWIALLIFMLCFSPVPFDIEVIKAVP